MIAWLRGRVAALSADSAVIDVQGVGYLVQASGRTLGNLTVGNEASLHVDTQVREESITLFGFAATEERDWFRLLTSVQGVGGRVALAILTALAPVDLARAIAAQDRAMIARANGVGPKLAQRIALELKDKAGLMALGPAAAVATPAGAAGDAVRDALSALANLGFRPADASRAVAAAQEDLGEQAGFNDLVRVALKKAAR